MKFMTEALKFGRAVVASAPQNIGSVSRHPTDIVVDALGIRRGSGGYPGDCEPSPALAFITNGWVR
jgi:hypothetical protein